MTIEIHCPFHATTETLELPDGYSTFKGEVACATPGSSGGSIYLKIEIVAGVLVSLERAW